MSRRGVRDRALATRRRVVSTAYRLFCAEGYEGTTMAAIAAESGVAVQTLYFTFHSKGTILGEALGAAIVGFDRWAMPPARIDAAQLQKQVLFWWEDFASAPDARHALAVFVEQAVDVLERVGPLLAALHGAKGLPDVDLVRDTAEERRVESYREALRTVQESHGALRRGLSLDAATDILLVLLSPDLYHAMRVERAWSTEQCKSFLIEVVIQQLLDG